MTPKEFQFATVRAVLRAFDSHNATRRFLVADEPGLGKTFVARRVTSEMSKDRLLTVLYVCSSQAIASQNVDQLLGDLPQAERESARAWVDRPSRLPLDGRAPTHEKLRIYSLTPGTAFSSAKRRNRGRVEERAFASALLEHEAKGRLEWLDEHLSWGAGNFDELRRHHRRLIQDRLAHRDRRFAGFVRAFRLLLAECLHEYGGRGNGMKLQAAAAVHGSHARLFVTTLCRNCLAASALGQLDPGLVIFDEFQKFRDLTSRDEKTLDRAEERIRSILTAKDQGRLLLLSATPYEALRPATPGNKKKFAPKPKGKSNPAEEENDFYRLLDFLWGNLRPRERTEALASVRAAFAMRETEVRRGVPDSEAARAALDQLVETLSRVMCRTERPMTAGPEHSSSTDSPTHLVSADVRSFRTFGNWLRGGKYAHWAVPLWSSVPMPGQVLGNRYAAWKAAPARLPPAELRKSDLVRWRVREWAHPKVRALLGELPQQALSAPWVVPTLPWWKLGGCWSGGKGTPRIDGKALVFSRFAAVPGALSAVVSFNTEVQLFKPSSTHKPPKYDAASKPSFPRGGGSPAMFTLFFVPEILVRLDPLAKGIPKTVDDARKAVTTQLRKALAQRGTTVRRGLKRRRVIPIQTWLIHLAGATQTQARAAWIDAVAHEEGASMRTSAAQAFDKFRSHSSPSTMSEITEKELAALAQLALDSPSVVLARAALRHWEAGGPPIDWDHIMPAEGGTAHRAKGESARTILQRVAYGGLKRYLDKPWFAAALQRRAHKNFPAALHAAVIDGNLESVLDEHFWFVSSTNSQSWPKRLAELHAALALTGGRTTLHEGTKDGTKPRVRCNVALPLHQAKDETGKAPKERKDEDGDVPRPDIVRHAFNTPFWPMVLTTTSVGQEGLDFHPWCKTVAHWDPAPGPVELEQRQGRVARYAGLFVRRALGTRFEGSVAESCGRSPWSELARLAEGEADAKDTTGGMSPWWCTQNAETLQLYLHCAGSREAAIRSRLERRRAIYRMVLGAAEPEWLIDELDATTRPSPATVLENSLDLGAWRLEQKELAREGTRRRA